MAEAAQNEKLPHLTMEVDNKDNRLHVALFNRDYVSVEELLFQSLTIYKVTDTYGKTPLIYAMALGFQVEEDSAGNKRTLGLKAMRILITLSQPIIHHEDHSGNTAFHYLIKNSTNIPIEDLRQLMTLFCENGVELYKEYMSVSLLNLLIEEGSVPFDHKIEKINLLIDHGMLINDIITKKIYTGQWIKLCREQIALFEYFIDKNPNILHYVDENDVTVFSSCVKYLYVASTKRIITKFREVTELSEEILGDAYISCVEYGNVLTARYLLSVDPDTTDLIADVNDIGPNAMTIAFIRKDYSMIKMLYDEANKRNKKFTFLNPNWHPQSIALSHGDLKLLKMVFRCGYIEKELKVQMDPAYFRNTKLFLYVPTNIFNLHPISYLLANEYLDLRRPSKSNVRKNMLNILIENGYPLPNDGTLSPTSILLLPLVKDFMSEMGVIINNMFIKLKNYGDNLYAINIKIDKISFYEKFIENSIYRYLKESGRSLLVTDFTDISDDLELPEPLGARNSPFDEYMELTDEMDKLYDIRFDLPDVYFDCIELLQETYMSDYLLLSLIHKNEWILSISLNDWCGPPAALLPILSFQSISMQDYFLYEIFPKLIKSIPTGTKLGAKLIPLIKRYFRLHYEIRINNRGLTDLQKRDLLTKLDPISKTLEKKTTKPRSLQKLAVFSLRQYCGRLSTQSGLSFQDIIKRLVPIPLKIQELLLNVYAKKVNYRGIVSQMYNRTSTQIDLEPILGQIREMQGQRRPEVIRQNYAVQGPFRARVGPIPDGARFRPPPLHGGLHHEMSRDRELARRRIRGLVDRDRDQQ